MPTSTALAQRGDHGRGRRGDLVGQAGAVGVAEGDVLGARLDRRLAGSRARSRGRRGRRRRSARRRRRPACPARGRRRPSRRSSPGSPRGETLVTFSRCRAQVLPTRVTTGAKAADQGAQGGVVLGGDAAPAGHAEGADRRLLELQLGEQLEELHLLRVGAGEAGLDELHAEPVERLDDARPSRPPRATCPRPACRRARSCRRASPVPSDAFRVREIGVGHGGPRAHGTSRASR